MRQIADVTVLHVVAEVVDVGREPESHAVDFRTLDLQGRDMMLEQKVSMLERESCRDVQTTSTDTLKLWNGKEK